MPIVGGQISNKYHIAALFSRCPCRQNNLIRFNETLGSPFRRLYRTMILKSA